MSALHRTRPGADAIRAARDEPAIDIGDGVFLSEGLSNCYLVRTDGGRVIINTGMGFEGPLHRRNCDAVDRSPTQAIVLTQGHYDHVGGLDAFREPATDVVSQANWSVWRDDNERLRAFRARNAAFAWVDKVSEAIAYARGLGLDITQARPEPTVTFTDELEVSWGGRRFHLIATPGGETTDALVVWLPDSATLFTGNLFGPLFGHVPNLVTMRGDRYRDALAYVDALDRVLELVPRRLVTGHFDPIDDPAVIAREVAAMRDATRHIHDRTVEGMEAGLDVDDLMREVTVPDELDVGEGYGTVAWNVRAIWEHYAGWFHHRSTTELYPAPQHPVAHDVVAAAGAAALVAAARARLVARDPVAALALTDLVRSALPGNAGARQVALAAHRTLLEESGNFWERAWLSRAIAAMESETQRDSLHEREEAR